LLVAELAEEARHLLSTSASRWRSLRASGREWRDTAVARSAWQAQFDRRRSEGQHFSVISIPASSPRPDQMDEQWQLWISGSWKRATFPVGRSDVDVVFHGSTWWSNGQGISRTNGGSSSNRHGEGPGQYLVCTADYPDLIEMESVTTGVRLGRDTLDAKVTIRHGLPLQRGRGLHGLVIGDADKILLCIERERGVILHASSWFQESIYRVLEVQDVAFDEQFPPETFGIAPLYDPDWVNLAR
jgi:hypothetical protein